MTKEEKNISAISSFLNANELLNTNSPLVMFQGLVRYSPLNIADITKVQIAIDTFGYGNIEIYETETIDINKVHTGFMPMYNDFSFSEENKTLTIKGQAHHTKGGGNYEVNIAVRNVL